MFQFRAFPPYTYLIQCTVLEYCSSGFPHSEISGSTDICSSPKLIAACHVLLRLLMPRHSPCALYSLTYRIIADSQLNYAGNLQILCRIDCYPHLFRCSTINSHNFSFQLLMLKDLLLPCFFITFSLFSFQGTTPSLF